MGQNCGPYNNHRRHLGETHGGVKMYCKSQINRDTTIWFWLILLVYTHQININFLSVGA